MASIEPASAGAFLSGDEIRELLRADAGGGTTGTPGLDSNAGGEVRQVRPPPRVLIVSRRAADVDLFKACLEAAGASTTVARNPFTALDRVRVDEPDLVVSDLDLWANDGALLLQRLRRLSPEPPLLFVADRARAAGLEERALRAGAAGVLLRPLRPGEVEDRLGDLLLRVENGSHREGEPPAGEAEHAAEEGGAGAAARSPIEPAGEAGSAELEWLRFFHGASRLARLDVPRADRARALVRRALQDLRPRAAAIVYREGGRAAAVIEAGEGLPLDGLIDILGPAPDDRSRLHVRSREPDPEVSLVLVGLPSSIVEDGPGYLDDVRHLLTSLLA